MNSSHATCGIITINNNTNNAVDRFVSWAAIEAGRILRGLWTAFAGNGFRRERRSRAQGSALHPSRLITTPTTPLAQARCGSVCFVGCHRGRTHITRPVDGIRRVTAFAENGCIPCIPAWAKNSSRIQVAQACPSADAVRRSHGGVTRLVGNWTWQLVAVHRHATGWLHNRFPGGLGGRACGTPRTKSDAVR